MRRTMTGVALAALIALTGCNNNDSEMRPNNGLTPILLGTGMQTKAPVNTTEGLNTKGIGIFAVTTKNTEATAAADWTFAKVMDNEKPSAIATDGGGITLSVPYYYPEDVADYVKFMAFHPYAAKGTSGDNFVEVSDAAAPQLNFTITGQEDVMYANPAIGNNTTTTAQSLKFQHALTQITFKVIKDSKVDASELKLAAIRFAQVNTKAKMNIETGELTGWTTPGNLAAFNPSEPAGQITIPASGESAAKAGEPVMLQPEQPSFKLTIVTSKKTYSDIVVTPSGGDAKFVKGKSYEVTITFNVSETGESGQDIQLSAAVQPWATGGTGAGTVGE